MSKLFVDIHTHGLTDSADVISVYNQMVSSDGFAENCTFSIGIHPWYIANVVEQKEKVEQLAKHINCIAIGECGLDKLQGPSINVQEELFHWQIQLSEKIKKPLLIHCVKAFDLLLKIKKDVRPKMSWIIHGFQGIPSLAKQLISANCMLSYGAAVLNEHRVGARQSLVETPLSRLFLETDNWDGDIEKIYACISKIKSLSAEELKQHIHQNFLKL